VDVELSHFPGSTRRHQGATAVEMCLHFVQHGGTGDLAVNPRVSISGVLCAYVLLQPSDAQQHAAVLTQVAHMADFQRDGDAVARMLFQGLALTLQACVTSQADALSTYKQCMLQIPRMLGGTGRDDVAVRTGIQTLGESLKLVEQGKIQRRVPTQRLAQYVMDAGVVGAGLVRALHIPPLGSPLTPDVLLSPFVRTRLDAERAHLVSVEGQGGWFHDVFLPAHVWTDCAPWWQPAGMVRTAGWCGLDETHPLHAVAQELQASETAPVTWMVPRRMNPFAGAMKAGRRFPVVLACVDDEGKTAPSQLHPQRVGHVVARAFG